MPKLNIRKKRSKALWNNQTRHILLISRSNKNIQAQVINPTTKKTLYTANTNAIKSGTKIEKAQDLSKSVSAFLEKNKINSLVFDRNGYLYHGRIKEFVDGIRSNNIKI